jgi:DNA-binding NarL/FixJ family response regulator
MPRRILIADDEASIRRAVRAFIESRSQFEVCEATDGTDALHKAVLLNPDLIVLDLSMPNANGVEVALRLRDRMPTTPVVLYTMFDEAFGKSSVRTLGIAAIVRKSDGVTTLLGRIEELLDAKDALSIGSSSPVGRRDTPQSDGTTKFEELKTHNRSRISPFSTS